MKIKYAIVLFLVFAASFLLSYFLRNSRFVEKLLNPKTTIEYHNTVYDFEDIPQNKEAATYFVYSNTGKSSLIIKKITSNCGCTVPKWSSAKLKPNSKDSILVCFDAEETGYFSKAIYIISNSESSPDALYIEGNVLEEK